MTLEQMMACTPGQKIKIIAKVIEGDDFPVKSGIVTVSEIVLDYSKMYRIKCKEAPDYWFLPEHVTHTTLNGVLKCGGNI